MVAAVLNMTDWECPHQCRKFYQTVVVRSMRVRRDKGVGKLSEVNIFD
jgi:hypothetical protein